MARIRQSVGEAMSEVEQAAVEVRQLLADLRASRVRLLLSISRSSDGNRLGVQVELMQPLANSEAVPAE